MMNVAPHTYPRRFFLLKCDEYRQWHLHLHARPVLGVVRHCETPKQTTEYASGGG